MVRLDDSGTLEEIGQIELVKFLNEGGLTLHGRQPLHGFARQRRARSRARPAPTAWAPLTQGFVEASNVELVEEMVNMIVAQRAYEVSAKAIQTSDSMLQLANQLRG